MGADGWELLADLAGINKLVLIPIKREEVVFVFLFVCSVRYEFMNMVEFTYYYADTIDATDDAIIKDLIILVFIPFLIDL